MKQSTCRRRELCISFLVILIAAIAPPSAADNRVAASVGDRALIVAAADSGHELLYRHGPQATALSLRSTEATLSEIRLVAAGVADVVYASWLESGADRFLSLSKDGGITWSEARSIRYDIPLRAGLLEPGIVAPEGRDSLKATTASNVHIVQFETISLSAWRERLEALGAEVLSYLPHNSHLVRMDEATSALVRAESFVRWVGPYQPFYRIGPDLLEEMSGPEFGSRRFVLMTFLPGAAEKALLAAALTALGGEVVRQNAEGYLMEAMLTADQALELLHSDYLNWVELWAPEEEDMDNARALYGANYIESIGGYDGSGVRGEVQDGGIQQNHQDFDGILIHGPNPSLNSHGTACYGIVFGNGDRDGDGQAAATGFMPAAQGYFSDNDFVTNLYTHVEEIVTSPINGVFMTRSVGSPRTLHYTAISALFDDVAWTYDFAIFQSQSNAGDQYSRPQAWAKNVFSVGGMSHFNDQNPANDQWSNGASIGPAHDGRIKPDLAYWYDSIYTTYTTSTTGYGNFGGTSGATPMTAGTSGLVQQMYADNIYGNNPGGGTVFEKRPHFSTLKAIMVNTAEQYPFTGPYHDKARVRQGWGIPDLANVLDRAPMTGVVDEDSALEELEFDAYSAAVPVEDGVGELKVTMVYSDRAANPAATVHTINDVTLKVIAPDDTVYWGNHGLEDGVWSTPGGGPDRRNVVENVFIQNPMAGDWRIEVHAAEVNMDAHVETPEDDVDYALVVYGVDSFSECRSGVSVPTGIGAAATGANEVTVSWSGSSSEYEIWRSEGGCGMPAVFVGTSASSPFVDSTVPGGVLHGYTVRGLDGCPSQDSACVETTTTGDCMLPPHFSGLETAVGTPASGCNVELSWTAGDSRCSGGSAVYNVYRSTDPDFTPGAANRVADCVAATSWLDDTGVNPADFYTYIVRAEDPTAGGGGPCGGVEDSNTRRHSLTPATLLFTDFESGIAGWTVFEFTSSTNFNYISGEFVVDDPRGTFSGGAAQPEDAAAGEQCLFTGRNPNAHPLHTDVTNGEVWARSPIFDASGLSELQLDIWRWYRGSSGDRFVIEVSSNGGVSFSPLESLTTTTGLNAWNLMSFDIHSAVSLTNSMQLRLRVADISTNTLVEAAFDDVHVWGPTCVSNVIFSDGFESGDTTMWSLTVE